MLDPDVAAPADHTPPARESLTDYDDLSTNPTGSPVFASVRPSLMRRFQDTSGAKTPGQLAWASFIAAVFGLLLSPAGVGIFITPALAAIAIGCGTVSFRRTPGWKVKPLALIGFVFGVLVLAAWARLLWFSIAFGVAA